MTTITISRQTGSGGNEIARRVCEISGYRAFDKHMLAQAAAQSGFSEQEVIDYSEENYKVRGFLERLFNRSAPIATLRVWEEDTAGILTAEDLKLSEAMALRLVQKAIHSAQRAGKLVIVGRGGQAVLKDVTDVLHVRIEAPLEDRIQRVKEELRKNRQSYDSSIDLRREAQNWIVKRDEASADYLKRFYNIDWTDPTLYHMMINTGKLSLEHAAQAIVIMAQVIGAQPATTGAQFHQN